MAENEGIDNPKIPDLYNDIWAFYKMIESTSEPINSSDVQQQLMITLEKGERAIHMLNILGLYSRNEDLEEVATNEMRYMLMPALLGYLKLKQTRESRYDVISEAQAYFCDYLRLVKDYGVTNMKIPSIMDEEESQAGHLATCSGTSSNQTMEEMGRQRAAKIERFKRQKEAKSRLADLESKLPNADDDLQREYYTALLSNWVDASVEELDSLRMELPFAKRLVDKSNGCVAETDDTARPARPAMQPFILTRDAVQAKVFGMGYSSLPTYTLEEFGEMQYSKLCANNGGVPPTPQTADDPELEALQQEARNRQAERNIENDDDQTLQKARDWDDWKDDHRRGWGNRSNRS